MSPDYNWGVAVCHVWWHAVSLNFITSVTDDKKHSDDEAPVKCDGIQGHSAAVCSLKLRFSVCF